MFLFALNYVVHIAAMILLFTHSSARNAAGQSGSKGTVCSLSTAGTWVLQQYKLSIAYVKNNDMYSLLYLYLRSTVAQYTSLDASVSHLSNSCSPTIWH